MPAENSCLPKPIAFETRFLLPLLYEHELFQSLLEHLLSVQFLGRLAWDQQPIPFEYSDNTLPFLTLFQPTDRPQANGVYLRLASSLEKNLFPALSEHRDPQHVPVELVSRHGVEMFVLPYGAAVISITLQQPSVPENLGIIREFNRAFHQGRNWLHDDPKRVPRFDCYLPHVHPAPQSLPTLMEALVSGAIPEGNAADRFAIQAVQRSLNVYTVVRLDSSADLNDHDIRRNLAREIAGLQGVWPTSHCGIVEDGQAPDHHMMLNRRHWIAVGNQGAAHLVCDQPESEGELAVAFNQKRMENAADKMLFQYLYPLLQRLALQAFSREVVAVSNRYQPDQMLAFFDALNPLRQKLTRFSLQDYAYQLSDDDSSARFYAHCQKALGVENARRRLDEILSDASAQLSASRTPGSSSGTNKTFNTKVSTLHKLEWIEVFVATVFAVGLVHIFCDSYVPPNSKTLSFWYPGMTLALIAGVTILSMISVLNLWSDFDSESHANTKPTRIELAIKTLIEWLRRLSDIAVGGRRRLAFLWIAIAVAVHIVSGM